MKYSRILSMIILGLLISLTLTPMMFAASYTVQMGVDDEATAHNSQRAR